MGKADGDAVKSTGMVVGGEEVVVGGDDGLPVLNPLNPDCVGLQLYTSDGSGDGAGLDFVEGLLVGNVDGSGDGAPEGFREGAADDVGWLLTDGALLGNEV